MITDERLGNIAVSLILKEREREGITFNPSTVKRDVHNEAKSLGVSITEMAEYMKIVYLHVFKKTMKEIDSIIEKGE